MTVTGNGSATSWMRSNSPCSSAASSSPSTIASIRGRRSATVRGVNALDTRRRRRVWSGGSRSSIPSRTRVQNGSSHAGSSGRPISACVATWR